MDSLLSCKASWHKRDLDRNQVTPPEQRCQDSSWNPLQSRTILSKQPNARISGYEIKEAYRTVPYKNMDLHVSLGFLVLKKFCRLLEAFLSFSSLDINVKGDIPLVTWL